MLPESSLVRVKEVLFGKAPTHTVINFARINLFSEIEKVLPDFKAIKYLAPFDARYVKMELLAVDYEAFVGPTPSRLIYRFRYTYQANGSLSF